MLQPPPNSVVYLGRRYCHKQQIQHNPVSETWETTGGSQLSESDFTERPEQDNFEKQKTHLPTEEYEAFLADEERKLEEEERFKQTYIQPEEQAPPSPTLSASTTASRKGKTQRIEAPQISRVPSHPYSVPS